MQPPLFNDRNRLRTLTGTCSYMLGSRVIPKRVAANTRQVPTMPPGTRYRGRALALFLRGGTGRGAALVDNSPERRFLS